MSLESRLSESAPDGPSVVTVGTFDGVHLGHLRLLRKVRDLAEARGATGVAVTFRQPPRAVMRPDLPTEALCSLAERIALMKAAGIDIVLDVDFDEQVRNLTARRFVEMLVEKLHMTDMVMGPGATVGRDRAGDALTLQALADEIGFRFHTVEPALVDGMAVRSTAIRAALAAGDVARAGAMLGRPFSVSGLVTKGDQRGRTLGYPTANLRPPLNSAIPANGIYATRVTADVESGPVRRAAATSVGVRPTFDGGERLVEAYLLDFDGDLYGRRITIEFMERLRPEEKFDTVEALVDQMARDVHETRRILQTAPA